MKNKNWVVIICCILLTAWTCQKLMAATETGSFSYDFSTDIPCAGTLITNCVDHFEIWDVTNTASPLKVSPNIAIPTPTPTTIAPVNFSFKIGPPYGARKQVAVAVAADGTASDKTASQAQATVNTKPGTPTTFIPTIN